MDLPRPHTAVDCSPAELSIRLEIIPMNIHSPAERPDLRPITRSRMVGEPRDGRGNTVGLARIHS